MALLGDLFAPHTGRHAAGRRRPVGPTTGPRVELSFRDGTTVRLTADSPQARAMLVTADALLSPERPQRR